MKFQNLQFNNRENFSEKFSDLYLMKIQISFEIKKIRSAFNENTDQFCDQKKKSDLYLMKIHISFEFFKKLL